jgi:hypothetical protein
MDVSDASYYIQENNENKGSQMWHTKKIFFKRKKERNKQQQYVLFSVSNVDYRVPGYPENLTNLLVLKHPGN